MNIVLFLGAGFSAAFDLPVMNEFLAFADNSPRITEEDRDFIGQLVLEARRANSFLESSPTNLEDILSFSVMADRLSFEKNKNESYNDRIRYILKKIFTQNNSSKNFWNRFDKFGSFLTFKPYNDTKHNLSVITTNYDLSIECSLSRLGYHTDPCFDFKQIDNNEQIMVRDTFYSPNGIPVMKLHGSVNWYNNENPNNDFMVEDRIVAIRNFDNNLDNSTLPYQYTSNYKNDDPPIIIPPSFLKPELNGTLEHIWQTAAKKLKYANLLVFVGYSFPQTDTEMLYFLATSLTDNTGLRSILLIDPYVDNIYNKIVSTESKFGTHFKDLLKMNSSKWQDTNLKEYLL